jgi:hypothetical protein
MPRRRHPPAVVVVVGQWAKNSHHWYHITHSTFMALSRGAPNAAAAGPGPIIIRRRRHCRFARCGHHTHCALRTTHTHTTRRPPTGWFHGHGGGWLFYALLPLVVVVVVVVSREPNSSRRAMETCAHHHHPLSGCQAFQARHSTAHSELFLLQGHCHQLVAGRIEQTVFLARLNLFHVRLETLVRDLGVCREKVRDNFRNESSPKRTS